jgi:fumarylacetoacetase
MLERARQVFFARSGQERVITTGNPTHDPLLRSWVKSANLADTDFPIQNLPFAIFRRAGSNETYRGGVAIGDQILDLRSVHSRCLFSALPQTALAACSEPTLNRFMALGHQSHSGLRQSLSDALREDSPHSARLREDLVPQSEAEFNLPASIGDYTDFYASIHHASAVGRQFRPDNPLLPNYQWMPVAYHGRSSSIGVSEQLVHRPIGQSMPKDARTPMVGPSQRLDFELEAGIFIGPGNTLGTPISIEDAEDHIFGLCLLNDWSARDLQGWEYQPLGPFLGKNFATTISPWIVTLEALAPFRLPFSRPSTDPQPLAYLDCPSMRATGSLDVHLEISLQTARMRMAGQAPQKIAASNLRHAYWTIAQMVAHHSVNGCNLRAGDLFGTGTLSGPSPAEAGSLLELTFGGRREISLSPTEVRRFLEDGDRVVLRAWCERAGCTRIGFGTASGTVLPARSLSNHRCEE